MAFDAYFLTAVLQEIRSRATGARVEKIHQPSRDTVIFLLRCSEGREKLIFAANPTAPRLHLTSASPENPAEPPMFCMLLRKRLGSGKLLAIRQDGLERVLYLDFSCINELGDVVQLTLACEIMGRYSNLILIDENGRIIDAIRRVDLSDSSGRCILPSAQFVPMPRPQLPNLGVLHQLRYCVAAKTAAIPFWRMP